jgi:hypothetical protein
VVRRADGAARAAREVIDQAAPAGRPAGRAAMLQRWSELLFLHWEVPAAVLRPLVPDLLDVDTFDGRAYVGLVPFRMSRIRPPWGFALPLLSRFPEINLRTYVRRAGRAPGVWFFSLDAANPLAVLVARAAFRLPYNLARMRVAVEGARVAYESRRLWPGPKPAACHVDYEPVGAPAAAGPGTLAHFLVERYVLYTLARGRLHEGRVHHPPYELQAARVSGLRESLRAAAGLPPRETEPLAHYVSAVDVELFALREAR